MESARQPRNFLLRQIVGIEKEILSIACLLNRLIERLKMSGLGRRSGDGDSTQRAQNGHQCCNTLYRL